MTCPSLRLPFSRGFGQDYAQSKLQDCMSDEANSRSGGSIRHGAIDSCVGQVGAIARVETHKSQEMPRQRRTNAKAMVMSRSLNGFQMTKGVLKEAIDSVLQICGE